MDRDPGVYQRPSEGGTEIAEKVAHTHHCNGVRQLNWQGISRALANPGLKAAKPPPTAAKKASEAREPEARFCIGGGLAGYLTPAFAHKGR
jgi:hypothetical protein